MQLWETSGHAANYKDNMFTFEVRCPCKGRAQYYEIPIIFDFLVAYWPMFSLRFFSPSVIVTVIVIVFF